MLAVSACLLWRYVRHITLARRAGFMPLRGLQPQYFAGAELSKVPASRHRTSRNPANRDSRRRFVVRTPALQYSRMCVNAQIVVLVPDDNRSSTTAQYVPRLSGTASSAMNKLSHIFSLYASAWLRVESDASLSFFGMMLSQGGADCGADSK